ncbi:MAG TPA: DNA polymerase III subunit delta [Dehalococcoidales bacterium]|nr:DNA polymerase III subunit delta [Dehalococcoidales bacterium]
MLYILWGEDEFSRVEALSEIKKGLGDFDVMYTNTNLLEGQKLTLNELRACVETAPFLSSHRLVVIKGLLERFEPKDKSARPKKGPREDESAALAGCINRMPPSTILVLTDTIEFKKTSLHNNPLFTAISEKANVRSFPVLKGSKLSQWIQSRVAHYSSSISVQATNLLMGYVGGDLFTMSNEIQKLTAYTAGRRIEEKDVRAVVAASQEADIFMLVDAILDHKAGVAEQILQKLLQSGVVAPQILALLARQVQALIQIKELKALKKSSSEIQSHLGIFSPFLWERMSTRAQRYTLDGLKEIYRKLLETDVAIKTGRYEADLAINILAVELCHSA